MQCPYCNQTHPDNASFCPVTGQKLKTKKNTAWIWMLVSIIGVGVLVYFIIIPYMSRNVISISNANQIVELDQFGRGVIGERAVPPDGNRVAWSPDSKLLVFGDTEGLVWICDVANEREAVELEGITNISSVAWSPNGTHLAFRWHDGIKSSVKIWDIDIGRTVAELEEGGLVISLSWSPDGTQLASGGLDGLVQIWDVTSGKEVMILENLTSQITYVAWSPDGTQLAYGGSRGDNGKVQIWDIVNGVPLAVLEGGLDFTNSIAWSPDGKLLALGGSDATKGNVQIWDTESWSEALALKGNSSSNISSIAWSPDGKLLASGEGKLWAEGLIRIWDVDNERELAVLEGHTTRVTSLAWSPDGSMISSASYDGTVYIWGLPEKNNSRLELFDF